MLFAETIGDFFFNGFLIFFAMLALFGEVLKRADKGGAMRKAGLKAGGRGLFSLFKYLNK